MLAACGGESGGGQAAVSSGKVELNLWTHDPGYVKTFTEQAKRLTDAPGGRYDYALKVTNADSEALVTRMISTGAAGRGTPDMIGIVISVFPRVMSGGIGKQLFAPLDDLAAPVKDDLLRTAPYSIGGTLYALESDTCLSVLYYREDEWKKNKIPADIATWEELVEVGAKLHEKTSQSLGMVSTGDNTSITNQFLQLLLQRGGGYYDEGGNLVLDSPEAVEVLEFMAKGVQSGFLIALPDPYGAPNTAALKNGKLISTVMPNWYNVYGLQANVPEQKGQWKIRNLPKFAGGGHIASAMGGTGFAVLKDKPGTAAGSPSTSCPRTTGTGRSRSRSRPPTWPPTSSAPSWPRPGARSSSPPPYTPGPASPAAAPTPRPRAACSPWPASSPSSTPRTCGSTSSSPGRS